MPRCQRTNPTACKQIGARFISLIEDELGLSLRQAASMLGYANATTLSAIKRGKAIPDLDRLLTALEKFHDQDGRGIDLNWLFTGQNQPFAAERTKRGRKTVVSNDIIKLWEGLSSQRRQAFRTLLMPH